MEDGARSPDNEGKVMPIIVHRKLALPLEPGSRQDSTQLGVTSPGSHWGGNGSFEELTICDEIELSRIEALASLDVAGKSDVANLKPICQIAQKTFGCKMAMITVVDGKREWVIASVGIDVKELPRENSFGEVMLKKQVCDNASILKVLDARIDDRVSKSLLVTDCNARLYAGAPLLLQREGGLHLMGTVCVLDTEPRAKFDSADCDLLKALASMVITELERAPQRSCGAMSPITKAENRGECLDERVQELKTFAPFARRLVDEGCIRMIAEKLKTRVVPTGKYLTRVGDFGDTIFFIAKGSCTCTLRGQELERLQMGTCFGEVALLSICKMLQTGISMEEAQESCKRNADVIALERCELLELSCEDAWPLLKKAPNLWFTLEDMAKRRTQSVARVNSVTPNVSPTASV